MNDDKNRKDPNRSSESIDDRMKREQESGRNPSESYSGSTGNISGDRSRSESDRSSGTERERPSESDGNRGSRK